MKRKQFIALSFMLFVGLGSVKADDPKLNISPYEAKIDLLPIELVSMDILNHADDDDALLNEEEGIGGDDDIPPVELYLNWNNLNVNPYNVSVDSVLTNEIQVDFSNFSFPLARNYRVTSEFGPRRRRYHYGIDLKVNIGDTVQTILDGVVRIAKKMNGYGNFVVVRHYNGMESFYGHLDQILVEPDQVVKSGQLLGYGGNTGRSTGPHLHFELRYLGQPINPRDMIDFESLCPKADIMQLGRANFEYKKHVPLNINRSGYKRRVCTVRKGDTLARISKRTGASVASLCALNGISKKKMLKVGQKIRY